MKTELEAYLESLGVKNNTGRKVCPVCAAKWPYCNYDSIRYPAPCETEKRKEDVRVL